MHSSDKSTQQKREEEESEPEELTITQFMQDQSDPESEEEVDFLNIKYSPFKHLPVKLSYKQIQEFREKGQKTPNEQLNWLNANKLWNSLNQDQKCLIAPHLLGDELFAKGEKQGLHLFTNEQKDGPMSIQFLCWWDDLETKFKDLKKKKKAEKLQKKFEYRQNHTIDLPIDVLKVMLFRHLPDYNSDYANNLAVLGKMDPNVPKNLDKLNKIIEFGPPLPDQEPETYNHVLILSKEQQDTIAELAMTYIKIYPLSPSPEAYMQARQKIVTVMREHRELDEVPPLNELHTEEENIRCVQKIEEEHGEEENSKEFHISSTADILQRINTGISRKEAEDEAQIRLLNKMFESKKTAREIFSYEIFRFDEWKKWESTTKEFRSLKEIEDDSEKDSDNADKDVEDVLEFINKNKATNEKDVKDQKIPDEEEQSKENLIKVTVNKLHIIFPKKTEQELKDEVQKRLKEKMTGDRKASRIFSDELLKDDEKEKWSNIEDDDTPQLDTTTTTRKLARNTLNSQMRKYTGIHNRTKFSNGNSANK